MRSNPNTCAGAPPEHLQCKANRTNRKRCRKWKLVGSNYCQFHGGRRAANKLKNPHDLEVSHLPSFYRKQLTDTLADLVDSALEGDPREALNLYEELALMRVASSEAVRLYSLSTKVEGSKGDELRTSASLIMAEALKNVSSMCESAARIESVGKDKYSVHSLKAIIHQIVRIAHGVLHQYPELALQFEQAVRNEIRLPTEISGTNITPDLDVKEMDTTVPAA